MVVNIGVHRQSYKKCIGVLITTSVEYLVIRNLNMREREVRPCEAIVRIARSVETTGKFLVDTILIFSLRRLSINIR